jgi:hypothetical protein
MGEIDCVQRLALLYENSRKFRLERGFNHLGQPLKRLQACEEFCYSLGSFNGAIAHHHKVTSTPRLYTKARVFWLYNQVSAKTPRETGVSKAGGAG